jgi:hypothetical protein
MHEVWIVIEHDHWGSDVLTVCATVELAEAHAGRKVGGPGWVKENGVERGESGNSWWSSEWNTKKIPTVHGHSVSIERHEVKR